MPHTWYCDEASDGGVTGFDALDSTGTRFVVQEAQHGDASDFSIRVAHALGGALP